MLRNKDIELDIFYGTENALAMSADGLEDLGGDIADEGVQQSLDTHITNGTGGAAGAAAAVDDTYDDTMQENTLNGTVLDQHFQPADDTQVGQSVGPTGETATILDQDSPFKLANHDPEKARPEGTIAHAYPEPNKVTRRLLFTIDLCMIGAIVFSFLSDPAYNSHLASEKLPGLFVNLPHDALHVLNWIFIGFWFACFVVRASRGEWSRIDDYKKKCLRLICLGLGLTALLLKWVEPDYINLSYAPGAITFVVEITYLFIDVVAATAEFFFGTAVPWLASVGGPMLSFFGTLVVVILVWVLYRG